MVSGFNSILSSTKLCVRAFELKENYLLILLTMSELCSSQDWKAQLKLPAADTRFKTEVCETESKSSVCFSETLQE